MPIKEDCPFHPIDISDDREVVMTDKLEFPWRMDPNGYFIIKIEDGLICAGHCTPKHKMTVEFRGKDPHAMIKEIAKRNLCDLSHMGYLAQELMIAKDCLDNNKKYVQR